MRQERAHISLNSRTRDALDLIKAPGQSYDGIIQQLIRLWNRQSEPDEVSGHQSYSSHSLPKNNLVP
jgi:hypothetical protein